MQVKKLRCCTAMKAAALEIEPNAANIQAQPVQRPLQSAVFALRFSDLHQIAIQPTFAIVGRPSSA
jgi:hypothetical protein